MVTVPHSSGSSSTPRPNYVDPPTRPPAVQVTSIMFAVLVTVSLVLRLYTRGHIKGRFGLDDVFATFATLLADVTFVLQVILFDVFHQGRHTWDIRPSDMYNMEKLGFIYFVVFSQAACQSKLSLLFFTHKMIGTARLGIFYLHYIALMALIVIVALCQILFIVVSCIQCHPLKAFWDPNPTYPHKCLNTGLFLSIAGIINTATDVLCTLLPALIVFKLQMPFRKRVSVASLFLVGIFVNVASALRIYFLFYQYENHDAWNFMQSSICSNLEIGLGLLCVNIPSLRPLVRHYGEYAVSYMHSYTGKPYNNEKSYSRRSDKFVTVGEDFNASASGGNDMRHAWRDKTGTNMDGIEVLRTVELNKIPASASKGYVERNQSDELPLHQ